jgi:hypothetical protein
MKRILYVMAGCLLMLGTACTKIDNYDGPNARLSGTITDKSTGDPFILDQGGISLRMWETSWSDTPAPRDIAVMADGTYNNTKLFKGTYSILPYSGAFWPTTDTIKGFDLTGNNTLDFELTPYLHVTDVSYELVGENRDQLSITCRLHAPIAEGMPNVVEIRPFLSFTKFCGAGNRIDYYFKDEYKIGLNRAWSDIGDANGMSNTFTIPNLPLDKGKVYRFRVGVQINNSFSSWNYSKIYEIAP